MVKALVVCNPKSGRGRAIKSGNLIKNELKEMYDCDILISETLEMLENAITNDIVNYQVLIICGGDGTFHKVINFLAKTPYRPKLCYIPLGTACDTGKNLRMKKSLKKSLEIIKKDKTKKIQIMQANDIYVCYAMACGKYVSTSFLTNGKLKFLGPVGYVVLGLFEIFRDYKTKLYVNDFVNPTTYNTKVVCVLNTRSIGSVTLKDFEKKIVSISGNVIFSLAKIVLKRKILTNKGTFVLPLNKDYIINVGKQTWSIDGEKFVLEGDIKIKSNACEFDIVYNDITA